MQCQYQIDNSDRNGAYGNKITDNNTGKPITKSSNHVPKSGTCKRILHKKQIKEVQIKMEETDVLSGMVKWMLSRKRMTRMLKRSSKKEKSGTKQIV